LIFIISIFCFFICLVIFGARGRARILGWADVASVTLVILLISRDVMSALR
jgi:hypothetical protein